MSEKYKHATWNGKSFWHGTSTIFLKSIRETGLGTINPSIDWKLLDLLRFLYNEIIRLELKHQVFDVNRASIEAAISQSTMDFGGVKLNFQHDGVYLSASTIRAATYACMNKVGSELLEKCLILLSILIDMENEPEIPKELDYLNVRQFLDVSVEPIMIEIPELPDMDISFEDGSDVAEKLKVLREDFPRLPIADQFENLQFFNFRLLKPVPSSALRFYTVDFEGNSKSGNFQFYLSRMR